MRGQTPARSGTSTVPYQIALRTSRAAEEVLAQVDTDQVPGLAVAERGAHYLVLRPKRRFRYGADIAAGLGVAVVLALLILTAVTPLVLVALPVAFVPAIPLLLDHRPDLAVSAIEEDGETRVTAHGQASPELVEYLDRYLEALPAVDGSLPEDAESQDGGGAVPEDAVSAAEDDADAAYDYADYEDVPPPPPPPPPPLPSPPSPAALQPPPPLPRRGPRVGPSRLGNATGRSSRRAVRHRARPRRSLAPAMSRAQRTTRMTAVTTPSRESSPLTKIGS